MTLKQFFFIGLIAFLTLQNSVAQNQHANKNREVNHTALKNSSTTDSTPYFIQEDDSENAGLNSLQQGIFFDTIEKQIILSTHSNLATDTLSFVIPNLFDQMMYWVGTKYKYAGKNEGGIDCSALAQKIVLACFQISIPRTANEQYDHLKKQKEKFAQQGDLVFFKLNRRRRRRISHVGILLNKTYFIHASSSQGVIVSNINDTYYKKRIAGFRKLD